MIVDWSKYPNFTRQEFACQHCGEEDMQENFMEALQDLRDKFGPMNPTSGYRCAEHPLEKRKRNGPGTHASGMAVDIAVDRADAVRFLRLALADDKERFTGFGIKQKGRGARFIHLDGTSKNRPTIWSY